MQKQTATLYTDGSSLGNPGPGGYGVVIEIEDKQTKLSGGEPHTTNNRMELLAAIVGLEWLAQNAPNIKNCTVTSDSRLVIETLNSNWKRKKNTDLWAKLDEIIPHFEHIKWQWVKGHNGHIQNTLADKLATTAATKFKNGARKEDSSMQKVVSRESGDSKTKQNSLF